MSTSDDFRALKIGDRVQVTLEDVVDGQIDGDGDVSFEKVGYVNVKDVIAVSASEFQKDGIYIDADEDVFKYVGNDDGEGRPWREFGGARRSDMYPTRPVRRLSVVED